MSEDEQLLVAGLYTIVMVFIMGVNVAAKHNAKREPDFGDFFMALIWPITIILLFGYVAARKEKK